MTVCRGDVVESNLRCDYLLHWKLIRILADLNAQQLPPPLFSAHSATFLEVARCSLFLLCVQLILSHLRVLVNGNSVRSTWCIVVTGWQSTGIFSVCLRSADLIFEGILQASRWTSCCQFTCCIHVSSCVLSTSNSQEIAHVSFRDFMHQQQFLHWQFGKRAVPPTPSPASGEAPPDQEHQQQQQPSN